MPRLRVPVTLWKVECSKLSQAVGLFHNAGWEIWHPEMTKRGTWACQDMDRCLRRAHALRHDIGAPGMGSFCRNRNRDRCPEARGGRIYTQLSAKDGLSAPSFTSLSFLCVLSVCCLRISPTSEDKCMATPEQVQWASFQGCAVQQSKFVFLSSSSYSSAVLSASPPNESLAEKQALTTTQWFLRLGIVINMNLRV